ncbi:GNAT family N-acetyltransferase [Moritella sp. 5]|uniref:GNAT family N-acetyltransferase n=1 Tax=Moritella sp. 5 TaxID=2746231 RepID=UPI001BABD74D|nr:GNAT family protein [Moritella sp. 5]QUM81806.1 GNAT family N-acetyltransferase [Moritella sp. 5]
MFTLNVDPDLQLAIVQPSFARRYLDIVTAERAYLSKWLPWATNANNEAFFLEFVRKSLQGYAEGKSMSCALVYQHTVVGSISFNHIDQDLKKVVVGYWLSEKYQGMGIVTKAVSFLIEYAFSELSMDKVEICAAVDNIASRRVCERLNMALEGIISNAENVNGEIVDHAIYGIHRTDLR